MITVLTIIGSVALAVLGVGSIAAAISYLLNGDVLGWILFSDSFFKLGGALLELAAQAILALLGDN